MREKRQLRQFSKIIRRIGQSKAIFIIEFGFLFSCRGVKIKECYIKFFAFKTVIYIFIEYFIIFDILSVKSVAPLSSKILILVLKCFFSTSSRHFSSCIINISSIFLRLKKFKSTILSTNSNLFNISLYHWDLPSQQ